MDHEGKDSKKNQDTVAPGSSNVPGRFRKGVQIRVIDSSKANNQKASQ
jgi:hypothetical protein